MSDWPQEKDNHTCVKDPFPSVYNCSVLEFREQNT